MGRADQTTKIKGMFVRPEQVAALVASHHALDRARIIARRNGAMDEMIVQLETTLSAASDFDGLVKSHLKLTGNVELVAPGSLPRDGLVIEDQRVYE